MIPPSFDYARPKTLAEARSLLGDNPEAKILAGGHSLIPMMRFRMASPGLLVDINQIEDLAHIGEEGDWLRIGAMTREADLDRSELVRRSYPLLADTARVIADPLVRNLATVGGNIAHADPANDHPATVLAEVVSKRRLKKPARVAEEPRMAKDPICGMTVAVDTARHVLERDGETVYFCGPACKTAYKERQVHAD